MDLFEFITTLNFSSVMWEITTPLIFSVADIVTGYIQAVINKNVDSQKMRVGLLHKALIVMVIILSFVIRFAFNLKYISSFVCIYVIFMEFTSIIENLKKSGVDFGNLGKFLKNKPDETTQDSVNKLIDTINEEIKK